MKKNTSKNGNTKMIKSKAVLKQRVIITFSRKMMEYQRHIRNKQIERAKSLVNNGKVEDVKTILDINAQRYQIEDCFRVMKTNMNGRPVFHHNRERIIAHFLMRYTSLLLYRLLEKQLKDSNYNFTINEIIETLRNMQVDDMDGQYYKAAYTSSKVCTALNDLYALDLDKKYYRPKKLNKKREDNH